MSLLLLTVDDAAADDSVAIRYARMMLDLLPPGKLWSLIESTLTTLFLGCADELARLESRAYDLLRESNPATVLELLPEKEAELGLVAAPSTAERQANVVAREVARQRFRPVDFQTALAPLLAQDADDVVVIERSLALVATLGDQREIFQFFIYRDPTLPGTYFLASAQALVDQIKPSHTVGTVIESTSFLYADPHSLYGRDLMGS